MRETNEGSEDALSASHDRSRLFSYKADVPVNEMQLLVSRPGKDGGT
jgi:hypothetical protein